MPKHQLTLPSKALDTPRARVPPPVNEPEESTYLYYTLDKVHHLINYSHAEIDQDIWLCLDLWPLYYIGTGTNQTVSPLTNKAHYDWRQPKNTLE